jgi:hypothetical protein
MLKRLKRLLIATACVVLLFINGSLPALAAQKLPESSLVGVGVFPTTQNYKKTRMDGTSLGHYLLPQEGDIPYKGLGSSYLSCAIFKKPYKAEIFTSLTSIHADTTVATTPTLTSHSIYFLPEQAKPFIGILRSESKIPLPLLTAQATMPVDSLVGNMFTFYSGVVKDITVGWSAIFFMFKKNLQIPKPGGGIINAIGQSQITVQCPMIQLETEEVAEFEIDWSGIAESVENLILVPFSVGVGELLKRLSGQMN